MHAGWLITNLVSGFLLPPLGLLLFGAAGFFCLRRSQRWGRGLIGIALFGLWLLCTPFVAQRLLAGLEIPYRPVGGDEADAIVVLGGGLYPEAVEYGGGATLHGRTLERVRYGAWLYRRIGKPILVTGGAPEGDAPEGRVMREVLEREFGVPVAWVEDRSDNTRENARFSAEILRRAGIGRIYLVSHVWHLPRAVREFEREGLTVVPAGTGYQPMGEIGPLDFLPNASALSASYYACHEWLGLLWYRLRS